MNYTIRMSVNIARELNFMCLFFCIVVFSSSVSRALCHAIFNGFAVVCPLINSRESNDCYRIIWPANICVLPMHT